MLKSDEDQRDAVSINIWDTIVDEGDSRSDASQPSQDFLYHRV